MGKVLSDQEIKKMENDISTQNDIISEIENEIEKRMNYDNDKDNINFNKEHMTDGVDYREILLYKMPIKYKDIRKN